MPKAVAIKLSFPSINRAVLTTSTIWQARDVDLLLAQPNRLGEEVSMEELTYSDAGVLFALM